MRTVRSLAAIAAILTGPAAAASAQNTLLVGPTLGINSAKVTGDNQDEASRRTGLRLGGFASLSLGRHLAVQPEITYSSKGAKWTGEDAEIKIGYIQVPVLARYRFASAPSRFAPYLLAGPAFAVKAGCTLIVDGQDHKCSEETTAVAGSDFGMILGAGAEFGNARFSLRYDLGLKNINGDGSANVKNQTLKVTVGYGFRLGR